MFLLRRKNKVKAEEEVPTLFDALGLHGEVPVIKWKYLTLKEKIGQGANSIVSAAEVSRKAKISEQAVVKRLNDGTLMQEFMQEVALLSLLQESGAVKMLGYCADPMAFLYYTLGSLYEQIHKKATLQIGDEEYNKSLQSIANDVMRAIRQIHDKGIIHNDIKPANVLLERRNDKIVAVMSDFGIASIITTNPVVAGIVSPMTQIRGASSAYAAPERLIRKEIPPEQRKAGDIFSFGITLLEMIIRDDPWKGMNKAQVEDAIIKGQIPAVPESEFKDLIVNCLQIDPVKRFADFQNGSGTALP
jgi:serine/threonine protein kinase